MSYTHKQYDVKSVKTFLGREGHGFNASLYENGKRVAFVIDSAQGGEYDYDWFDKGAEARLAEHAKALPSEEVDEFTIQPNSDIVVSSLIDEHLTLKDMRRDLKRRIIYTKSSGGLFQLSAKVKPVQKNIEGVKKADWWKSDNVILNELSESESFAMWK